MSSWALPSAAWPRLELGIGPGPLAQAHLYSNQGQAGGTGEVL